MFSQSSGKKKAFTLVELLVVIAIVGLLSTIVLAVTSGVSEQGRIAKSLQFSKHLENSLGDHLVGRWTFDETADLCGTDKVCDTSGWDNHGTMNNFVLPYGLVDDDTPSDQGKAVSFDGEDDYVRIPSFNGLNGQHQATISSWVKENTEAETGYFLWAGANVLIEFGSTVTPVGATNLRIRWSLEGDWKNSHIIENILEKNVWHFWTFTFNSGITKIYKDGVQVYNGSDTQTYISGSSSDYDFGFRSSYPFHGLIYEIFIYNRTLTASQIKSQYYAGLNRLLAKGLMSQDEYQAKLVIK
jgi:prepilin-type N-terminal cleavage/methylation domain-containing protein